MRFEQPAWEILHFLNEDVVCASDGGIDLPGQNVGGGTDHNIDTPQGTGGISGPVVPIP